MLGAQLNGEVGPPPGGLEGSPPQQPGEMPNGFAEVAEAACRPPGLTTPESAATTRSQAGCCSDAPHNRSCYEKC